MFCWAISHKIKRYLEGDLSVLETLYQSATDENRARVRDMLGAFMFRGDDVEKKLKSSLEANEIA